MRKIKKFFPDDFYIFIKYRAFEILGLVILTVNITIASAILTYNTNDICYNVASSNNIINNLLSVYGALIADLIIQYAGYSLLIILGINILWGCLLIYHHSIHSVMHKQFMLLIAVFLGGCLSAISAFYLPNYQSHGVLSKILINYLYNLCLEYTLQSFFPILILPLTIVMVLIILYSASLQENEWRKIIANVAKIWRFITFIITFKFLRRKSKANSPSLDSLSTQLQDNSPSTSQAEKYVIPQNAKVQSDKSSKKIDFLKQSTNYTFPSLDLLQEVPFNKNHINKQEIAAIMAQLLKTLNDFGVKGKILCALPGPIVTLYEFEPDAGTKSARVIGLADDIARSMRAISARIAVIPGKNVIGIELPNKIRNKVFLRELLSDEKFIDKNHKLNISLGQTISGENTFADLTKMPHMIVAGTTGSGKSVAINTMILSLLYQQSHQMCKLLLIDPKMLELSIYNNIPHLLAPVVTNPKKAIFALKWAVREMEERYKIMSNCGVRNIENYNQKITAAKDNNQDSSCKVESGIDKGTGEILYEKQSLPMEKLPYIVIIVDEMADLMMVAGKDIEAAVQRLAQMARAAGMHLIMATQRPSVDVITGTIKANFPTRISFHVASKFDSRTILGEQGAEQLLGSGDMLFSASGRNIQRLHGPFVSDAEVNRVVDFLKQQGKPEFVNDITQDMHSNTDTLMLNDIKNSGEQEDELYASALDIIRKERKASTSFIQRRLQIGYNRAARLIEQMEQNKIISAANHAGKREILIKE